MKRLLAVALALFGASAFAATLNPVSLLNPAGSNAGQGIVSTGPTTAPVWGSVAISTLTGILPVANGGTGSGTASGARTNLGLGTSATVNTGTSGATVPLLNTANTWALAQTFTVGPTAPTASVGTNTTQVATTAFVLANAVTSSSPTITTPNIVGVTNASNAVAGSVGEFISLSAGPTGLVSGTSTSIVAITLTAGDWDVSGVCEFQPAASTVFIQGYCGVNTTTANLGGLGQSSHAVYTSPAGFAQDLLSPVVRFNVSATTTVYLVMNVTFNTSTANYAGFIRARRIR